MENNAIRGWIGYIRLFVDMATRYPIKEYSYIGGKVKLHHIELDYMRQLENGFYTEIRRKKIEIANDKLQFIYDDIQRELYPTLNKYFLWYEKNLPTMNEMKMNYNFYEPMYSAMQNTKSEIERINNRIEPNVIISNQPVQTNLDINMKIDMPPNDADENIKKLTLDFYENYFAKYLKGNDTLYDFTNRELHSTKLDLKESIENGTGNLSRLRQHKVNTIKLYMDNNNIKIQGESEQLKPVDSFNKIDWKKDERLIPFLIHLLNESGYISEKNQFSFIEKHFTVKGKNIKRGNIKANYQQADYLNKPINKSPKEIKELSSILDKLNSILDII